MSRPDPDQNLSSQLAICTVHGNNAHYGGDFAREFAWPKLQIARLKKHTNRGYRIFVYAHNLIEEHEDFLRSCDNVELYSSRNTPNGKMEHVWPIRNWLARKAARDFKYILHLDSDAFPVADDWLPRYAGLLSRRRPVVAVQRLENGDTHSDRCFLMHTSKGLHRHLFDFSMVGVVDAGANISLTVAQAGLEWTPLTRSNAYNFHPLIAGIYDDRIYHHAAGSRLPKFRMNAGDFARKRSRKNETLVHRLLMRELFQNTDIFLKQLRGQAPAFDLKAKLRDRALRSSLIENLDFS